MNNAETMSATKEKQKIKKMSKAQIQLAIIKKKQCDAKALAIVEQLLEPNINSEWLLQNLRFINKSHMEDIIEERAIIKLCGYVLCSKPLTVIIRQQYHISVHRNKVYDISRRKNFCSSSCYGAANYLLEQMLESPLWLREVDDIPIFRILPINSKSKQCVPGDEINIGEINPQNIDADNKTSTKCSGQQTKEDISSSPEEKNICSSRLSKDIINDNNVKTKEIPINSNSDKFELHSLDVYMNQEKKNQNYSEESIDCKSNCTNILKENLDSQNLEIKIAEQSENIPHSHEYNSRAAENKNIHVSCTNKDSKILQSQLDKIINKNDCNEIIQPLNEISNDIKNTDEKLLFQSSKISNENNEKLQPQLNETNNSENDDRKMAQPELDEIYKNNTTKMAQPELDEIYKNNTTKMAQPQLNEICNNNATISSESCNEYKKKRDANRIKNKKYKQTESCNAKTQANIYHTLVMHVEQSVKEWVTENTLCLLMGETDEKHQLLESLMQYDRYQQLCKKLNKLQLEDEKEKRVNLERNVLKPLPHFSALQEEGKKIDLKVRAFYEGRMTITSPEDNNKESNSKDDDDFVLPLTDAHTPNALRRRIFLDKLNKILPDLMRTLTTNAGTSSMAQCTYDHERYSLIKMLITTFNLSASNIVFKTAEWTLVGLILIKMLSLIDVQLQSLLQSKQVSMYTSMILMTYKLDSSYLDRLIMEVTNTTYS
ncbi:putative RNA polymerase II subunit B1 CTD phosphatase RPAP2 isoform X2 [Cataglyphis hispanica]|uniref:putative RNA polymerase II subunit B1 CTD phosphatase RPAP2 isoform X2 n=1 Tax=Cataglyphis hispanica TaxID=1086592 RepID=UPI0021802F1F|nr:putative RNA polymerase II subunit B1 CTD phosphatase RPAP2 isoform X2 [Cataglyphis hispanica]